MIWYALLFDSRTPLVVIRDTLTAQRFVNEILRTVVLPFLSRKLRFIFQQDIICPHTARLYTACLRDSRTIALPARSPDLLPNRASL